MSWMCQLQAGHNNTAACAQSGRSAPSRHIGGGAAHIVTGFACGAQRHDFGVCLADALGLALPERTAAGVHNDAVDAGVGSQPRVARVAWAAASCN